MKKLIIITVFLLMACNRVGVKGDCMIEATMVCAAAFAKCIEVRAEEKVKESPDEFCEETP